MLSSTPTPVLMKTIALALALLGSTEAAPAVVKTTVDGKHVALHACKTKAGVTIAVQTEL